MQRCQPVVLIAFLASLLPLACGPDSSGLPIPRWEAHKTATEYIRSLELDPRNHPLVRERILKVTRQGGAGQREGVPAYVFEYGPHRDEKGKVLRPGFSVYVDGQKGDIIPGLSATR